MVKAHLEKHDIREGDPENIDENDELPWRYLGVEYKQARVAKGWNKWNQQSCEEPVEVVLDSGADCHVSPMWYYSEELGTKELPELKMVIADAQGNPIRTTAFRANITFEFEKENGKKIKVINSAVFGNVTQPLFAVGKLWKCSWGIDPENGEQAWLRKGRARIPIRFHNLPSCRRSTARTSRGIRSCRTDSSET